MTADPLLLLDGPADASATIILAHGAGAAMDAPFMNYFATGLADRGLRVVRFEILLSGRRAWEREFASFRAAWSINKCSSTTKCTRANREDVP